MSLKLSVLLKWKIVHVLIEGVDTLGERWRGTLATRRGFCKDCIFVLEATGNEPLVQSQELGRQPYPRRKEEQPVLTHRNLMPVWGCP